MGQAKNRGTLEERIQQAIQRNIVEARIRAFQHERIMVRGTAIAQALRAAAGGQEADVDQLEGVMIGADGLPSTGPGSKMVSE